jgi:hypothetical protein
VELIGVFITVASTPLDRPNLKKQLEEIDKTEDAAAPSIKEGGL